MSGDTTMVEPPAAVVARDPHWAATMARLRARKLPERTASFTDDPGLKRAVTEAALRLADARARAFSEAETQEVPQAQREEWIQAHPDVLAADVGLGAANKEFDDGTVRLRFRALPRPAWEGLLRAYPPSEEQADAGHEYDVDRFPAALISASSVDGMSEDEAQDLLDTWAEPDARALFTAAMLVNQTSRADLGKG
ncbi:hypothetical protein [Streptomyces sp. NPDC088925]|uniref:hypothetical protein n=1 Tax=Streptomyces sp. NPDC088925 TaxID=3365914 RepID=UPI00381B0D4D